MVVPLTKSAWKKQTTTFEYLHERAKRDEGEQPIFSWLKIIGIIPMGINSKRTNRLPNTNLDPSAIPAGYLAEVAQEWDRWGITTPLAFVEAIEYEVSGTSKKAGVNEVLGRLGI